MASKQVVDRQKEAQAVIMAGTTHASEVARQLAAILSPELERGEKLPDVELLMQLGIRALTRVSTAMGEADEAYQRELLDDVTPRKERDEAAATLRERVIDLRDTLSGLFGEELTRQAGFTAQTPSDPALLSRFAGDVSKALRAVKLPRPRLPGLKINAPEICDELDVQRQKLDQALADVARETREAQAAASARDMATAEYDALYGGIANFVIGLLKLAGKHDLAGKVRLTWRRTSTPPEDPTPDPAPPAPAP